MLTVASSLGGNYSLTVDTQGMGTGGGAGLYPGNHAGIPLREGGRLPLGPLPGHRRGAGNRARRFERDDEADVLSVTDEKITTRPSSPHLRTAYTTDSYMLTRLIIR